MRYPPNQKTDSRKKIINAARSVFANVGFDKATIDQIMSEAGMTRGGFNKHFPNKAALLIEVIRGEEVDLPKDVSSHVGDILRRFLDDSHLEDNTNACTLFTFPNDVARHDDEMKTTYEDVAKSFVDFLMLAQPEKNKEQAKALMAMCVGCKVVMNSSSDPEFKKSLREATLKQISELTDINLSA